MRSNYHFSYHLVLIPILALLTWTLPALGQKKSAEKPTYKETYTVLSTHETDAVFKGTIKRPCRFLTAECPDRCNHGGVAAQFTITRYLHYKKPGKYGDAKTKELSLMLKTPDMDQAMIEQIKQLKPGTPLKLNWEHRYITRVNNDGTSAKFPRRVITKLATSPLTP